MCLEGKKWWERFFIYLECLFSYSSSHQFSSPLLLRFKNCSWPFPFLFYTYGPRWLAIFHSPFPWPRWVAEPWTTFSACLTTWWGQPDWVLPSAFWVQKWFMPFLGLAHNNLLAQAPQSKGNVRNHKGKMTQPLSAWNYSYPQRLPGGNMPVFSQGILSLLRKEQTYF